jgi:hypothetical protein
VNPKLLGLRTVVMRSNPPLVFDHQVRPPRHELWSSRRIKRNSLPARTVSTTHAAPDVRLPLMPVLTPGVTLPPDTLAAAHLALRGAQAAGQRDPNDARQPASFLPFQVAPFRNWPVTTKRIELVSRSACCSTPRPSTPESWQPGALENICLTSGRECSAPGLQFAPGGRLLSPPQNYGPTLRTPGQK